VNIRCILLLMALLLSGFVAEASERDILMQRIAGFSHAKGFSCQFQQNIQFSDGSGQQYTGSIEILRPGRFRWVYQQPYEQLYVGDGRIIWHYEPDLMQVQRLGNLDAVDPMVMQLLDGRIQPGSLILMDVAHQTATHTDAYKVRIGEKGTPVWLAFDRTGQLVYVESTDALGNANRINFTQCSLVAPPVKHFIFHVPDGVDVVDVRTQE